MAQSKTDILPPRPRAFRDRRQAGRALAPAYEVAVAIRAPLDVFTVRKLGVPGHEEYAMGAIASGGASVLGAWYDDFSQVTDDEVRTLLNQAALRRASMSTAVADVSLQRRRNLSAR